MTLNVGMWKVGLSMEEGGWDANGMLRDPRSEQQQIRTAQTERDMPLFPQEGGEG